MWEHYKQAICYLLKQMQNCHRAMPANNQTIAGMARSCKKQTIIYRPFVPKDGSPE